MTYIGIDTSLASTGLYILSAEGEFYYNYRNNDKLSKWHKTLSYITYHDYDIPKMENYSDQEIAKLIKWDDLTTLIVEDILKHCTPENTMIWTEGFSYSSNAGPLIDLVTYATLLRKKLVELNFNSIVIKAPSTLKLDTCKKTYTPIEKVIKGKKPRIEYIYKNDEGISGGRFQKREMIKALFDFSTNLRIKDSLLYHKKELLEMKNIPKPIDDMVDACWLVYSSI